MAVLFNMLFLSFASLLIYGGGETTCDCSELLILKDVIQQLLLEKRMESIRLRRLEANQNAHIQSKTAPGSNDRLEKLEQKVEELELKFNDSVMRTIGKHMLFVEHIGETVKKTLISEKRDKNNFFSLINENIIEHRESIETFKDAMNNTIEERMKIIEALRNEQSHEIEETLVQLKNMTANSINFVYGNMSTFQKDTIMDVNRRLDIIGQVNKSIRYIAANLNTVNQSISEIGEMINQSHILIEANKDWLPWSDWGKCSEPCNAGIRERNRTCASQFGCRGNSKDFSICNTRNCEVRLVNGRYPSEGRLEVLNYGVWGTVCDDSFDIMSARVVCRMLNFQSGTAIVYQNALFGKGTLPILLDDVKCNGSESNIFSCSHKSWGTHNCAHGQVVGISCVPIRLVNGSDHNEGRLEVFHNGLWGTVCADGFSENAAHVVCRMLNFQSGAQAVYRNTHFGRGNLPILLDNVHCNGSESDFNSCSHISWGSNNCSLDTSVGISCVPIRLENGSDLNEGRLEVFHDGLWGTVCEDGFSDNAASVVCKMMGFQSGKMFVNRDINFGLGTLPVMLDNVQCNGSENNIITCAQKPWGPQICGHGQIVGISCLPVRLANGSDFNEGRLNVFNNGLWGAVCEDGFTEKAARVVCKMLNFQSGTLATIRDANFGRETLPVLLDDVQCTGSESSIFSCPHRPWGSQNCSSGNTVGVSCVPIRLVNGSDLNEGRLEVFHNGLWGTVCEDGFTKHAAHVACNMLYFSSDNVAVYSSRHFGQGSLPILLDGIKCLGSESSIFSCPHNPFEASRCQNENDVGISCAPVRLVNGRNSFEGRLEVFHNGVWGTVCEDNFNEMSARVGCNMMNLASDSASVYSGAHFGQGSLPISLNDVKCRGSERSLFSCSHNPWGINNCSREKVVGISCEPIAVRLINGSHLNAGRLEVFHNGSWGTVCDDEFNEISARVVCRMLKLPRETVKVYYSAHFGQGSLPILLDDIKCLGSEENIFSCPQNPVGTHDCQHTEDVGISCGQTIRLVDGRHPYEGRLELFYNDVWGTVCAADFNKMSASVACKMLNFPSEDVAVYLNAYFGKGSLPTLLDNVACRGSERSIFSCEYISWGSHTCDHDQDVGISCTPIRLVNGRTVHEGRLEVFYKNTWGTVCDDHFNEMTARVACKMLNLPSNAPEVYMEAHFGEGSLPIVLDDVQCDGSESSIFSCPHVSMANHDCRHSEDVGILCL